ncbi:MAG TPA: ATP-binding protein [Candidatus Saccharimonadales bacterium]
MNSPRLYLFVGYPGAGKTTIAKLIHEKTGAIHLWADHERHVLFEEVTHSKAESQELYTRLNAEADALLAAGKSVIFDTNFNFRADRDHLRDIARKHGAETLVIWVKTPRELAQKRAVEESHDQDTRIWGNMPAKSFERLANNLQPPDDNENFITIDGTDIDPDAVLAQLGI